MKATTLGQGTKPRAIGLLRVSQRDDDSGHSPAVQRRALTQMAALHEWKLAEVLDENVDTNGRVRKASGTWTLADRPQLRRAVEDIESGKASILAAENFDRLFRNLDVMRAVIRRVEVAGGEVWERAGRLSMERASDKAHSSMKGVFAEYVADTAKERSRDAVDEALAAGRVPWPGAPVGYLRDDDGRLKVDRQVAPTVRQAFKLRAKGATIEAVRDYLASRGVDKSYHGVAHLLRDRAYLGEIWFGQRSNLTAHKPIITRDLFDEVQRQKIPRGRRAPSDRILARLGVLRCGTCGGAMSVGTHRGNGRSYPFYRCPGKGSRIAAVRDCPDRVAIGATIAEDAVIAATREAIADVQARAGAAAGARQADADLRSAQADLDAALATFTASGVLGEPVAVRRLADLRQARDDAQARKEQLGDRAGEVILRGGRDWDRLSLDARRDLIRAVVRSASVRPGRGPDRITIELYGD